MDKSLLQMLDACLESHDMLNDLVKINGKTTLVTGATGGLGEEIVRLFSSAGQKVIALGRSEEKLNKIKNDLVVPVSLDLNDEEAVKKFAKEVEAFDNLILCHGIIGARPMRMLSKKFIRDVIESNLISTLDFVSNLLRANKINKPGRIVFISSISAYIGANNTVAYAASKAGCDAAFNGLARDLLKKDITVNSIAPAAIDTPLWEGNIGNAVNNIHDYPLGLGQPQDVANAAYFLCLQSSKFITGEAVILDGGSTMIH